MMHYLTEYHNETTGDHYLEVNTSPPECCAAVQGQEMVSHGEFDADDRYAISQYVESTWPQGTVNIDLDECERNNGVIQQCRIEGLDKQ